MGMGPTIGEYEAGLRRRGFDVRRLGFRRGRWTAVVFGSGRGFATGTSDRSFVEAIESGAATLEVSSGG